MAELPPKVTPETIVRGFDAAYGRLTAALEQEQDPETVFLPLFETLSWTDLLLILEHNEEIHIGVLSTTELKALKWARGHAHHSWGKILEIGDILRPGPLVMTSQRFGPRGPVVVRAWKWVEADRLNDTSHPDNREAYVESMGGKPAHEILGRFRDGLSGLR